MKPTPTNFIRQAVSVFSGWLQNRLQKPLAFMIWRALAGGKESFYGSPKLERFKTNTPPDASEWFGLKLMLWNGAVEYLLSIGELTHTPTLKGKF